MEKTGPRFVVVPTPVAAKIYRRCRDMEELFDQWHQHSEGKRVDLFCSEARVIANR